MSAKKEKILQLEVFVDYFEAHSNAKLKVHIMIEIMKKIIKCEYKNFITEEIKEKIVGQKGFAS